MEIILFIFLGFQDDLLRRNTLNFVFTIFFLGICFVNCRNSVINVCTVNKLRTYVIILYTFYDFRHIPLGIVNWN